MSKFYGIRFGNTKASAYSGLSPTFTVFNWNGVTAIIPSPLVIENPSGSGMYGFTCAPTFAIIFEIDGGATVPSTFRYLYGVLDPIQAVDQQMTYLIGIGSTLDNIGFTASDPSTVLGFLRRNQEFEEGDATFVKSSGTWQILTRGGTLLIQKLLTDSITQSTKS